MVVFQMIGGNMIWIMIHGISYPIFLEMEGITPAMIPVGNKIYIGCGSNTSKFYLIGGNLISFKIVGHKKLVDPGNDRHHPFYFGIGDFICWFWTWFYPWTWYKFIYRSQYL